MIVSIERALYGFFGAIGYFHPFHPPATHIPIGLVVGAFLLGLASLIFRHSFFGRAARYCTVIASCFFFLTVFLGYLDWHHFYAGGWLLPIKLKIALAVLLPVLLFWALFAGWREERASLRVVLLYALSVLVVLGLGYMGGQLVYSGRSPPAPVQFRSGKAVFANNCSGCHPYGGNIVDPAFPLRNARQLKDGPAFLGWIRDPRLANGSRGVMPPFPASRISDQQSEALRGYLVNMVERQTQPVQGEPSAARMQVRTDRESIEKGRALFDIDCTGEDAVVRAEIER